MSASNKIFKIQCTALKECIKTTDLNFVFKFVDDLNHYVACLYRGPKPNFWSDTIRLQAAVVAKTKGSGYVLFSTESFLEYFRHGRSSATLLQQALKLFPDAQPNNSAEGLGPEVPQSKNRPDKRNKADSTNKCNEPTAAKETGPTKLQRLKNPKAVDDEVTAASEIIKASFLK